MATAMLQRLRQSTERLLWQRGGLVTFTKYAATKDLEQGSVTWAVDSTVDPIQAAANTYDAQFIETVNGQERRICETVLHVAVPPFDAIDEELTADWRPTIGSTERRLKSAVMATDGTFYVARFADG